MSSWTRWVWYSNSSVLWRRRVHRTLSQQDPLPRAITVVGEGFRFRLSLIAGAIGAIVATGREEDPDRPWWFPEESLRYLTLLPLAVRSGTAHCGCLAGRTAGMTVCPDPKAVCWGVPTASVGGWVQMSEGHMRGLTLVILWQRGEQLR